MNRIRTLSNLLAILAVLVSPACTGSPEPASPRFDAPPTTPTEALERTVTAMKDVGAVEIEFRMFGTGARQDDVVERHGTALLRPEPGDAPAAARFVVRGPDGATSIGYDGTTVRAVDADGAVRQAAHHAGGSLLLQHETDPALGFLLAPDGLMNLGTYELRLLDRLTIDDVPCDGVAVDIPSSPTYRLRFGAADGLPRRMVQEFDVDGEPGEDVTTLTWTVLDDPPTDAELEVATPSGSSATVYARGGPLAGQTAPPFTLGVGEDAIRSQDLLGNVVVLDFWATWCAPCKESVPALEELRARFADAGLRVVGATWEDEGDGREHLAKLGGTYPSFVGDDLTEDYGLDGYGVPTLYVIGGDGRVVDLFVGYFGEHTDGLVEAAVERALGALDAAG